MVSQPFWISNVKFVTLLIKTPFQLCEQKIHEKIDINQSLTEDETLSPGRHLFRRGGYLRQHPSANLTNTTIAEVPASIS